MTVPIDTLTLMELERLRERVVIRIANAQRERVVRFASPGLTWEVDRDTGAAVARSDSRPLPDGGDTSASDFFATVVGRPRRQVRVLAEALVAYLEVIR